LSAWRIPAPKSVCLEFGWAFRVAEQLVRTIGLCRRYGSGNNAVNALANVDLLIERGEFVAILGRSGSGKSTLMNLLGLLDRPDAGEYTLNGREVGALSEDARAAIRRRDIGFVFQLSALLPRASALENVELPLAYAGIRKSERRARAVDVLARVGLTARQHHLPQQLSGGEQQRVAIARALVNHPALILADEPTGALDQQTSDEILELIKGLHRDGRTIVVVTHAPHVADCADRRIVLDDGHIVGRATVQQTAPLRVAATAVSR